jgi:hypothetical protein
MHEWSFMNDLVCGSLLELAGGTRATRRAQA